MGLLKKYRVSFLIAAGIILVYLLTRLLTLTLLPIFTDEAIYLRWAQIAGNDPDWLFISLTDGKQPLYIWITMLVMKFISDPLIAGRLVSVGAGFTTLIGLFFLASTLFKRRSIGFLTALFYVFSPFSFVYDRFALYDSLVGSFFVWGLYLSVLLMKKLQLKTAVLLGVLGGMAVLNKTSGFFIVYLLPLSLLFIDWTKVKLQNKGIRILLLLGISIVLTYFLYSLLRISPFFYIIDEKNSLFVYPLSEWLKHPFRQLLQNTTGLTSWFITYMTYPLLLVIGYSFVVTKQFIKEKIILVLWFLLPFFALILFGKQLYPRYIFFMVLPLFPLASFSLYYLFQKKRTKYLSIIITLITFIFLAFIDYKIVTNFSQSPIPEADKGQYYSGWPSGIGVKESTAFFHNEAKSKPIHIATIGTFGLLPYAYEIYLHDTENISIKGYWPIQSTPPRELVQTAKKMKVYVVFYQECPSCPMKGVAPSTWPLNIVYQVKKEQPNTYLTVYEFIDL